ncbi:hypothetical protein BGZ73_000413 [Actinomortierella ambigua]|nr:hypothetical protein BGZ73_000413 [Actinomortierella ambigua]
MELAEKGSLQNFVGQHSLNDWQTKERIAQEIARGLVYIHSEKIIHRDLKSGNVLLDGAMGAKICDFGLSSVHTAGSMSSGLKDTRGTTRWMAPELFTLQPKYTTKSDMYALGCIMWEMAADSTPPFAGQSDMYTIIQCVKDGGREEIPADTPDEYRRWIEWCWRQDPMRRPEAFEIVSEFIVPETNHPPDIVDLYLGSGTERRTSQPNAVTDAASTTTTTTTNTKTDPAITFVCGSRTGAEPTTLQSAAEEPSLRGNSSALSDIETDAESAQ